MRTVVYIISGINKSFAFEWIAEQLDKDQFNLSFILLNQHTSLLEKYLIENNFNVYNIRYRGKRDLLTAFLKVYFILKRLRPDVIHTHLLEASMIGLSAAKLANIKKRVYTRHHAMDNHLFAKPILPYDKFINYLATDIVAISENIKNILAQREGVPLCKLHLIHHGFKLDYFSSVSEDNVSRLKEKLQLQHSAPIIGVISRYMEWKGIQYIIAAHKELLKKYPNAVLILANTEGNYKKEIRSLLKELSPENYREIAFEEDVFSLYKLFNVFVHVPINSEVEAFGQTYVEALASGIPSVFTLSGIASEFIVNRENALVVPFRDSMAIFYAIVELLVNKNLAGSISYNGREAVKKRFELDKMIQSLEKLYSLKE